MGLNPLDSIAKQEYKKDMAFWDILLKLVVTVIILGIIVIVWKSKIIY